MDSQTLMSLFFSTRRVLFQSRALEFSTVAGFIVRGAVGMLVDSRMGRKKSGFGLLEVI